YNDLVALPNALYSTAQVRALDAHAINELGIAGYTLMKRAGEAALRYLRTRWPMAHRIVIVCGRGNNAGDGYVLARFAHAAGLTVTVLSAAPPEELRADARQAYEDFRASGGVAHPFSAERLTSGEVIVDALLGTGLEGDVRPELAHVIRAINSSGRPVFALDVPSGLDSDAGVALGEAVRADATVTFVGLKTGLLVGDGPEFAGAVFFDDLELAPAPSAHLAPRLTRIVDAEIREALPRRARSANKGNFGRVLIVGSGSGMPGAARRAGGGWVLGPQPVGAGRLRGVSAEAIRRARLAALDRLIERFHGTIVLKGAGTLVGARGRTPGVCERGNPGMATAGSGDVLTGA